MKLTTKLLACAALTALALVSPITVHAQGPKCGQRDKVVVKLADKFKEARVLIALTKAGMFEVFVSRQGTWTALHTRPDGIACVIGSGTSMELIPELAPGRSS